MADLGTFAKRMKLLGQRIEKNADAAVRKCALAVDAAVVIATPVDTGRARANWQVEVNQPETGVVEPYVEGKEGSTAGPNAQAAIEQGKTAIAQYKGGTPGAAIYITNNLPYIEALNNGHSAQAPHGFVEQAVMVGVEAIKNFSVTAVRTHE